MNFRASFFLFVFTSALLAFAPAAPGDTTATLTTLHNFTAVAGYGVNSDGRNPFADLVKGSDGTFYGTTNGGGTEAGGTVFKITPDGNLFTLHSFTDSDGEGHDPRSALILANDGNFYGTTFDGGTYNGGTIYRITPNGAVTTLYDFAYTDGATPNALIQGRDGKFYGTTSVGGASYDGSGGPSYGTIFCFTINETGITFDTLHNFVGSDGSASYAGLIEGSDGNFYGTTSGDGTHGDGTVFKITTAGMLTTLYSFQHGSDGSQPHAGLVQGKDGSFYGTTANGGSNSPVGTVFKITPAGMLTTLHVLGGNGDGGIPFAGLIQGSDGNFYGTTAVAPGIGNGTVFQITPAGVFTTLHAFASNEGDEPRAGLVEGGDGRFYGTTGYGGTNGNGTIFELTVGPTITSAASTTAQIGQPFSYQITATYHPTSYGVQGLPAGLSVNAQTGLISGTPRNAGKVTLTLNAFNAAGKGSAPLALTIAAPPPVITSATTVMTTQGSAFSYQIKATNNPTGFGVQGLPTGITLDAKTGLITGTPKGAGKVTLTLNAYNAAGKGSATLTLTIKAAPPVVTSAATASGKVGTAFSYQISATNNPTSFGVQGLPAGFTVDTKSGLISGTPKAAGKFTLTLNTYNTAGKGSATLMLIITAN